MRYILIELDDSDDESPTDIKEVACDLADFLSDELGVIAQVIYPVDKRVVDLLAKDLE